MKEYNATLIDYGEGKGKLVVESKFGKVTFAVKADSHMWVELERPHGEWEYLKEHITDMRDADGKLNQKETCQFILDLMMVIEKEGDEK